MDSQIHASATPSSTKNMSVQDARRSVTYHPTIWGDYFLQYSSNDILAHEEQERQKLKDEVKMLLAAAPDGSVYKLDLIDAIQRLGVGYHFEIEIEKSLKYIYETYHESYNKQNNDLRAIALRFRLFRQQGYYVSCDVFNKFKDSQGKFEDSLIGDVPGLLSLYEAAHFGVHGEEILEEALKFSTFHLGSMIHQVSNSLPRQVSDALEMPIHKTLTRLGVKKFLSIYQESGGDILLNFAKLDFDIVQKMHQKELSDITRWWKALEFGKILPFARDRLVECYFWILCVYFEPQYSLARKILTKVIAMTSIIDDIYDVYGTLDELKHFTDAIKRWDFSAIDQLPSYMKYFYKSLLDVYLEAETELGTIGKSYRVHYAIDEMKKLVQAYFEEAKWTYSKYTPTLEEYMKAALVSTAYMMLSTTSLVGMGELVTKEAFDWISSEPLSVRASSIICRLMDDMVGHGFEQKIMAVECYIKETGASKEDAFAVFQTQVMNAWKDINQECLNSDVVPMVVLVRVVNLTRVINLLYKDSDGYTNSKTKLKDFITSILIQPATISN
ncbi:(-)-germacrene D synthase [Olea europaea subsp. europaea]|uniref:(-)-germacrene D synthase n=1 Tax=Olea europaea subsp. europaea TaxID=158383 RepID=A0A8S0Q9Z9_OLEEU|nr:(-)-germacrene D synthase [Olea europaea subsp. europaea]